jgi:hypothetical protein
MNGDNKLVHTLIDRLTAKVINQVYRHALLASSNRLLQLPHRTGSDTNSIRRDEIVILTRATLIEISKSVNDQVIDALVSVLDNLSKVELCAIRQFPPALTSFGSSSHPARIPT